MVVPLRGSHILARRAYPGADAVETYAKICARAISPAIMGGMSRKLFAARRGGGRQMLLPGSSEDVIRPFLKSRGIYFAEVVEPLIEG
jgi:hypothetical protein